MGHTDSLSDFFRFTSRACSHHWKTTSGSCFLGATGQETGQSLTSRATSPKTCSQLRESIWCCFMSVSSGLELLQHQHWPRKQHLSSFYFFNFKCCLFLVLFCSDLYVFGGNPLPTGSSWLFLNWKVTHLNWPRLEHAAGAWQHGCTRISCHFLIAGSISPHQSFCHSVASACCFLEAQTLQLPDSNKLLALYFIFPCPTFWSHSTGFLQSLPSDLC